MNRKYKKVHIWEFPPTKTFIRLNDKFRRRLFLNIKTKIGNVNFLKLLEKKGMNYGIYRKYNSATLHTWRDGHKRDRGKIKKTNIPLWVLIEASKILSNSPQPNNKFMKEIEKNVVYYTGWGMAAPITNPNLPLLFTPEMISILFHLCGDGHVGTGKGDCSHYRQVNQEVLNFFRQKLENVFGNFETSRRDRTRVIIPRIITDFYRYYFDIEDFSWDKVRIPEKIKNLQKNFLLAGLSAFIVDEGHIEDFVEIYSKNYELLNDILEITLKLGYKASPIKKKYKHGKFDSYRFTISPESLVSMHEDIKNLQKKFPTCGMMHKDIQLKQIVKIRSRKWKRRGFGKTKKLILKFLKNGKMTARELALKLSIKVSSTREHLLQLEKKGLIERKGNKGRAILWNLKS